MTEERDPLADYIEEKGKQTDAPNVPYDGGDAPVPDESPDSATPEAEPGETTVPASDTPEDVA